MPLFTHAPTGAASLPGEGGTGVSLSEHYDVIIVGAAFAGVSCAQELQRQGVRTLLLDRWEPGSHSNSACLAPLHTIEQYGAADAVLEVYDQLAIHTPIGDVTWKLPVYGCIFDYQRLFHAILQHTPIEFHQTRVISLDQEGVTTSEGQLQAVSYVDASGWRAVLASSRQPSYCDPEHGNLGVGVETELDHVVEGLHIYINPSSLNGYAWAFGCQNKTRFGVMSYHPCNTIRDHLVAFVQRFGIHELGPLRGTRIPFGLRNPVVDQVFVVGDAAGQVIPTSAEGIRPALHAGENLGRLLAGVFHGEYDLDFAKQAYRRYHQGQYGSYRYMRTLQHLVMTLPPRLCLQLLRIMEWKAFMSLLWRCYGQVFED
jgi:flavin-dependent dehydrogenase